MRHPFDAALESAEPRQAPPPTPVRGLADLASEPPAPPQPDAGSHSLWEFAAAWTPEADPPPPRAEPPVIVPPRPSARPEDIGAELGLETIRTPIDVARTRRRFMWENHPDRRNDLDRDLANRRVAIANMLLDRALAFLARRARR